jgi:DNA-binding transcriptional LysR family regulator
MSLAPWDELRTALQVARAGTVSGAAQVLGVHHATVIRHIDALEDRLGVKLFQRHAKGYTPTEAGAALADVARGTEHAFDALATRLQGLQGAITGDLIVTSVPELCPLLMPVLLDLAVRNPGLVPCLRTESRVLQLEYGEAHVALRAGARPEEPDNIVQPLGALPVALYASQTYLDRHGLPDGLGGLAGHSFVSDEGGRAPFERWLRAAGHKVAFRSNDRLARIMAIQAGQGLGFLSPASADGLVQVVAPQADWAAPIWLVTHMDLHRAAKVQAATAAIKDAFAGVILPPV